jgi:hypothetical protein
MGSGVYIGKYSSPFPRRGYQLMSFGGKHNKREEKKDEYVKKKEKRQTMKIKLKLKR